MIDNLVSTIIPVYNRPGLIVEAIESVLAQTHRPIEIIVVNDGSTDGTGRVIDRMAKNHPEINVVHQENSGVGLAREAGRQLAKGEFVQYLDSDDLLLEAKFETQIKGLRENLDARISYCITRFRGANGELEPGSWKRTGEKMDYMFPAMLNMRWWGTSSPLYRRDVVDHNGPWLDLINEEDWEYDCRIAKTEAKLHHAQEILSEHRNHEGDRLSRDGYKDPFKLADRAVAHEKVLGYALEAGISLRSTEMQYYAKELFLLSRQCAVVNLTKESKNLFNLSRKASCITWKTTSVFVFYRLITYFIGWKNTALLYTYCYKYKIKMLGW